jgi:hypothetical protein
MGGGCYYLRPLKLRRYLDLTPMPSHCEQTRGNYEHPIAGSNWSVQVVVVIFAASLYLLHPFVT